MFILFSICLHLYVYIIDGLGLNFDAPYDCLDLNLPLYDEDRIADHGGINLNLEPPVNASHKW